MINAFYTFLASFGYTHPIHPVVTHIPMGMILGGVLFALASFKKEDLLKTTHYCFILALIFIPPTILFGITDWQYRFYGEWGPWIAAKFILAGLLTAVLAMTVYVGWKEKAGKNVLVGLYILSAILATGLGFIGGHIQYG